ncbi:MAG: 30S ribosomal protein S6 [Deltaproteobacteria bacterium]|nr:30S ribosomal protein S6 [Deltaproteobacteria bacterium]
MMRDYEAVFITSADLNSEEQAELLDRVRGFISRFEGQICREYFWGRRKLAYPIKKKDYGIYHLWYLSGDGAMLEELERQFGYSEQVIRAQIIKVEDWESAAAKFESLVELKPAEEASEEEEVKEVNDSDAVETEEESTETNEDQDTNQE